jgi:uncharacterized protein YndB with AHSA1/START domain
MDTDARVHTTHIHTTPSRLWEALTTPGLTRRYFDLMEGYTGSG